MILFSESLLPGAQTDTDFFNLNVINTQFQLKGMIIWFTTQVG